MSEYFAASVWRISAAVVSVFPLPRISAWTITLATTQPVSAISQSSWPSCKNSVLQCFLEKYIVNPQFLANSLLTDEAQFKREGIVNFHNTHVWVGWKPPTPPSLQDININLCNVWVGISSYQLFRPDFFPTRLAGTCTVSLGLKIYQISWEMCLLISFSTCCSCMMWHHLTVEQYLNLTFGGQWVAGGGPVNWSVGSPVVNSLQLWLWGTQRPSYIQYQWMRFYSNNEKLKVVLTSMGTTQRICCSENTNFTHVSLDFANMLTGTSL